MQSQPATGPASAPADLDLQRRRPVALPPASQPNLPPREALMTSTIAMVQPSLAEVLLQMPDPTGANEVFEQRLAEVRGDRGPKMDERTIRNYERTFDVAREYLKRIPLEKQTRLTLRECLMQALANNYSIRAESFNPSITRAQVVEAEAAFDAEFFLEGSLAQQDPARDPTQEPTVGSKTDVRTYSGGFRQLLPTGMQVSTGLGQSWQRTELTEKLQVLNPSTSTNWITTLRQPLLRGFGLDVNRAQINLNLAQNDIANEQYFQRVIDTMLQVETAYWNLFQLRRTAAIQGETTAQYRITYENLVARKERDVTEIELSNAFSQWNSQQVVFLESIKRVRDQEDALKNLINDPNIKLSENLELIPTDLPFIAALAIDKFAEVRTALDERPDIREAKSRILQTRINTAVAKNQTLPQLDVQFQYELQGLDGNSSTSFSQVAEGRFSNYALTATFSYPIGNRSAEARLQQTRFRESQAIVGLNAVTDNVIVEVNNAVRRIAFRYEQMPPSYDSVTSAIKNLYSLQARTQRIDPAYLQTELQAVQDLGQRRITLLQIVTDYNIGMVDLERAKGTLLQYNNIVFTDVRKRR